MTKEDLKDWCEKNMNVHTDWTGTRVGTNDTCLSIDEFVDNNCHNCKAYPVCGAELVCCPDWDKFIEDKNKEHERNNN